VGALLRRFVEKLSFLHLPRYPNRCSKNVRSQRPKAFVQDQTIPYSSLR
jgi:hypothetical protein